MLSEVQTVYLCVEENNNTMHHADQLDTCSKYIILHFFNIQILMSVSLYIMEDVTRHALTPWIQLNVPVAQDLDWIQTIELAMVRVKLCTLRGQYNTVCMLWR